MSNLFWVIIDQIRKAPELAFSQNWVGYLKDLYKVKDI